MSTFTIFLILIIFVAFLLVVVIMVQNPKGGGLSSSFGGGGTQQLGGVKKTTDFLDRSTWTLATILLALVLLSNIPILGVAELPMISSIPKVSKPHFQIRKGTVVRTQAAEVTPNSHYTC